MKTMKMLSPDDPGWARAWGEIARVYGDPACAHPEAGDFRVLDHDAACGPGGDCEQAVR